MAITVGTGRTPDSSANGRTSSPVAPALRVCHNGTSGSGKAGLPPIRPEGGTARDDARGNATEGAIRSVEAAIEGGAHYLSYDRNNRVSRKCIREMLKSEQSSGEGDAHFLAVVEAAYGKAREIGRHEAAAEMAADFVVLGREKAIEAAKAAYYQAMEKGAPLLAEIITVRFGLGRELHAASVRGWEESNAQFKESTAMRSERVFDLSPHEYTADAGWRLKNYCDAGLTDLYRE